MENVAIKIWNANVNNREYAQRIMVCNAASNIWKAVIYNM
jgi:hypothetical protein